MWSIFQKKVFEWVTQVKSLSFSWIFKNRDFLAFSTEFSYDFSKFLIFSSNSWIKNDFSKIKLRDQKRFFKNFDFFSKFVQKIIFPKLKSESRNDFAKILIAPSKSESKTIFQKFWFFRKNPRRIDFFIKFADHNLNRDIDNIFKVTYKATMNESFWDFYSELNIKYMLIIFILTVIHPLPQGF